MGFRTIAAIAIASTWFAGGAVQAANLPELHIDTILEERYKDDDLAAVIPQRLELICKAGPSSPWGFCFAGLETDWRGPIELEVSGSGDYEQHDIFSFAGVTVDYGREGGWSERSFIGLGLIQASRSPHPPSWGVGGSGKLVMRGNVLNASPQPQRVTIDPSKYAPQDWDGRLWIGLCTHNIGAGKFLKARIVNATPRGGATGPELDDQGLWKLTQEHQKTYLDGHKLELEHAIRQAAAIRKVRVAPEMTPYAKAIGRSAADRLTVMEMDKASRDVEAGILPAQRFLRIVSFCSNSSAAVLEAARSEAAAVTDLNSLFDQWKGSGRVGREMGCIIRAATNLEKIGLTDVTSGRLLTKNPEPIRISAARHEYEGFQIVLTPLDGCAKKVSISVSDLRGPGGSIPSSEIAVNPVGYVRIFPGEANETLIPDPLLICAIPDLSPGENQSVWVTIKVPDDATAGEYTGTVQIASGAAALQVPLVLNVRDFALPHKISLRSSFWMFRDQINRFYGVDEVSLDDYFKWIDMALEHRLCPIDVVEGQCKPLVDAILPENGSQTAGEPNPSPDFTQWDRYIDRMVAGGASTIHLGLSHHYGAWFSDAANPTASPAQIQRVIESIKTLRDHYRKKGVFDLHYMQLRDETSAPDSLNVYREVKKALPGVKLLLTAPSAEAKPFLDIPCPLTPGFDAAWRDEVKSAGGEYWWYVCLAPTDPWANMLLPQTAAQHRALFWQTWNRDVDGLLYWGMNFWRWYGSDWPKGSVSPNWRVPSAEASNFCSIPSMPGDGFSMYPGPSPSQPLSSVRLENMRDGEEDYEYFLLLDKLIEENESNPAKIDDLRQARAVRLAARKLVDNMTDYPHAGKPYLDLRDRIASSIQALIR